MKHGEIWHTWGSELILCISIYKHHHLTGFNEKVASVRHTDECEETLCKETMSDVKSPEKNKKPNGLQKPSTYSLKTAE